MTAARVGIIGAGQLGRMMALAGYPIGIRCLFVDTDANAPGGQVAPIRPAALDDLDALEVLARDVDVLTFDIENVSIEALERLNSITPVYPPPASVAVAQDRLAEKNLFASLSIPTAPFVPIDAPQDLECVGERLGWPVVLKARRLGYDGRGQRIVRAAEDLAPAWESLGRVAAIAEGWIGFERELSLVAVRGAGGAQTFYPLTENVHADGILISSLAPYEHGELQATAESWLGQIMRRFDYRGVLTVEFFQTREGLIANEMAPRVHNSGHWTIEGAETSQFENHLRAVLGWPLGSVALRGHTAMLNLLGRMPPALRLLAIPGAHLHDYGKEPRPARKLGHCTILDRDRNRLLGRFADLKRAAEIAD